MAVVAEAEVVVIVEGCDEEEEKEFPGKDDDKVALISNVGDSLN